MESVPLLEFEELELAAAAGGSLCVCVCACVCVHACIRVCDKGVKVVAVEAAGFCLFVVTATGDLGHGDYGTTGHV